MAACSPRPLTPRRGRAPAPGNSSHACGAATALPRGAGGNPLVLSHGFYNTIYGFVGDKFLKGNKQSYGLLEKVFSRFMEGKDPTHFSLTEKLGMLAQGVLSGKIFELAKPANVSLWNQFAAYFKQADLKTLLAQETEGVAEPERRAFLMANLLANQLAYRLFTQFLKELSTGNLIESVRDVSTLAPVLLLLSPYIYAFQSQTVPRNWLREICDDVTGEIPPSLRNTKRAWFTDTLEDVNGVATTIRKMTAAAVASGRDLVVVTSRTSLQLSGIPIKNFPPIGEFELPEYELQKLSFPPILQILDYIQRERFTELIISTPGPIGITALIAAKMLGLRTSGIYHTDFPQYVRILTDDSFLETLTWNYMHWFYSQFDLLYVNSDRYRRSWADRGIAPEKIKILPRGLDNTLYHPSRRDMLTRQQFGAGAGEISAALRRQGFKGKKSRCPRGGVSQVARNESRGAPRRGGRRPLSQGTPRDAAGGHLPATSRGLSSRRHSHRPMYSHFQARLTRSATWCSRPWRPGCPLWCRTKAARRS